MEQEYNAEKMLLLALVTGVVGLGMLAWQKSPGATRARIIRKVEGEAARLETSIDPEHLDLALQRFDKARLRLFERYVDAYVARDIPAIEALAPEWKAVMLPVITEAPEWKRYEGIIFGT